MSIHQIFGYTIETEFDLKPIPDRSFDWQATLDTYDGAPDAGYQPVGFGRTEQEAIDAILEDIEEHTQGALAWDGDRS